jgi:pimeloyl-ACP methyl ester carboxylesterase
LSGPHRLHYAEWGAPDSPRVIVCAHGYSGNARDFDYLASHLAQDARVISIDFPGRGDSEWPLSPLEYNFAQFVADARTLLAQQGLKSVDWIGTSMGGLLGMMLAAQPSSPVRRLVMNDIGAFVPMDALQQISRGLEAPESFATLAEVEAHLRRTRAEWGPIGDAEWKAMALNGSRPLRPGSRALRLHFDPRIAQVARPIPLTPGLFFWDSWYRVRCPVLLMRGERSRVFPRNVADTMLDVRPDARLVEIPGCGHVPSLMTDPQATLVRDFLQDGAVQSQEPRRAATQPAYTPRAA